MALIQLSKFVCWGNGLFWEKRNDGKTIIEIITIKIRNFLGIIYSLPKKNVLVLIIMYFHGFGINCLKVQIIL